MAEYTPEQILNESYDLATKSLKVIGGGGAAGLATEAKQDDGIALLTTIDADTSVLAAVDFATETTAATLATEATVATLATEATAASIDGKITACDTGAVVVSSGAITETNSGDIKTAIEKLDDLQGALKSVDTDELVTRVTDSAGTEINPAKEDGNLATVKTNTDPLVTAGGGGYVRQDSTGTIAKETGGNLAAAATSLGTIDNIIATDDGDPGATPPIALVGGEYRSTDSAYTDGDATILQTDAAGKLKTAGYDTINDLNKTQEQSPVWSRTIAWVQLVTSAQDLTGAMATMGSTITIPDGYKYLRIPFQLDGNDSRSVQVQVVYEIAASGTNAIPYDPNKWALRYSTLDATQKIRTLDGTVLASLDAWFSLEIELDNANPAEIKVQVMAGTVGGTAGQIDNAYYKFGY